MSFNEFKHPIIGQEVICPDGLGRVVDFLDEFPFQWIRVSTYIKDRGRCWDYGNVQLLEINNRQSENVLEKLNLVFGSNFRDGKEHSEWHFPCGCAFHPVVKKKGIGFRPHIHFCLAHSKNYD